MSIKVSVIVPVYNPGRYLVRCVDSVLGQSLPESEYEAVFVDDGSTDESPARLDALAAAHPNIRVIHQENSGWPGKPRNVGIAAANGEYVFFLDHDDALGPEALGRLYDFATRNGSDVVIGKMTGHQRVVPRALFARTRDRVTLWDAPIVDVLTPHKLFRRAFLAEHGLRFPEGRRRLEDYVFVLEAYFAASVISVLSDPVCYHWYLRPDARNASTRLTDPANYYGFLREVLGVVEAHTEPGPRRDAILQRFARVKLLDPLRGSRFLGHPDAYRATLFAEIRSVVEDHIPPTVDEFLAPFKRTQMALVRAGRLDLLVEAAKWEQGLAGVALRGAPERPGSGPLELTVEVGLAVGRQALGLEPHGEGFLLDLPRDIAAVVSDDARAVPVPLPGGASILARRRGDSAVVAIRGRAERRIERREGRCTIVDRVEAAIDPGVFASGSRARLSTWDVVVRISIVGVTREVRVAQLQVTADHGVILRRGTRARARLAGKVRRLGLAGVLALSRHMDNRLRKRLWRVAVRVVRRLDA
jgi:glycosyltransferase involved in cell wall biosynthesis